MSDNTASGYGVPRGLRLMLKTLATITLLVIIVRAVSWNQVWSAIATTGVLIITIVFLMRSAGIAISSLKWKLLLDVHELRYAWSQLFGWYLIATFLGNLLPTSIGGDAYRMYKTFHNPRGKAFAVAAIVVERATGFIALVALGFAGAIAVSFARRDPLATPIVIGTSFGLLVLALMAILWTKIGFATPLAVRLQRTRIGQRVIQVASDLAAAPRVGFKALALSMLFHTNKLAAIWLLLLGSGASVGYAEVAVAMLIVEIIGLAPIALGGLGLVDGSFILVMQHFGVDAERGLAVMLLLRALMLPPIGIGGFLYARSARRASPNREQSIGSPSI